MFCSSVRWYGIGDNTVRNRLDFLLICLQNLIWRIQSRLALRECGALSAPDSIGYAGGDCMLGGIARITLFPLISAAMVELLLAVMIRMIYQYLLDNAARQTWTVIQGRRFARALFGLDIKPEAESGKRVNAAAFHIGTDEIKCSNSQN